MQNTTKWIEYDIALVNIIDIQDAPQKADAFEFNYC